MSKHSKIHQWGNSLGLLGVCLILLLAFYRQLCGNQLPCPLCLMQRLCFIAVGICLCMNLIRGIRPSHYGLMLFAAILGFAIALKQVFLHMAPGDAGYGSPLFGLYLYTWAAIIFAIISVFIACSFLLEQAFFELSPLPSRLLYVGMYFFLVLIVANGISTFLECGASHCRDNPVSYYLLETTG